MRSANIRMHSSLLGSGVLCRAMYEAIPPTNNVGTLLYKIETIQQVKRVDHL